MFTKTTLTTQTSPSYKNEASLFQILHKISIVRYTTNSIAIKNKKIFYTKPT